MNADKEKKRVMVLTSHYRIIGDIFQTDDVRMTDYMIDAKPFIPISDADVMSHEGRLIFSTEFMNVHKDTIEIITPIDLIKIDRTR